VRKGVERIGATLGRGSRDEGVDDEEDDDDMSKNILIQSKGNNCWMCFTGR
jgi:hypothetical protein